LLLGVALSAGALWLALSQTSLSEIGDALGQISWPWFPLMVALKASTLVVKDLRWRCELQAMAPGPYRRVFRCVGLGYFGNIVLPFKLGELLRVGLLKRHNPGVRFGDVLATIAAERALDGAVLAVMVGAVLHWASVPAWVMSGTILLLCAMVAVILLAIITPLHQLFLRILPENGPLGWARRVVQAITRGTAVLRKPRAMSLATAYTALAWLIESLVFFCGVQALGLQLGYSATLVVTLLLSVGLLIPSAPGQIGTHQALSVLFLEPFGIDPAAAVSISFLLQGVALTTLGGIGGYVLVREAGARELVRKSQAGEPAFAPEAQSSDGKPTTGSMSS